MATKEIVQVTLVNAKPSPEAIAPSTLYFVKASNQSFGSFYKSDKEGTILIPIFNPKDIASTQIVVDGTETAPTDVQVWKYNPGTGSLSMNVGGVWISMNNEGQSIVVTDTSVLSALAGKSPRDKAIMFIEDMGTYIHHVGDTRTIDNMTVLGSANGRWVVYARAGYILEQWVRSLARQEAGLE